MDKCDSNRLLKLLLDAQEFADKKGFVITSETITQASKQISWDVQMTALRDRERKPV
jgi:hypothetical protein